ncbi:hypothetical protein ACHAXT_000605 [Thalassiosira profunda]
MATEPRSPETCTGEVCVGDDVRPNVIAGGVGEDATLNHDAAGPDAPDAPSSFASDQPAKQDASLGQRHVASTQHQRTAGSSAPSILLGLALLGAFVWRYCKRRMQQKEWQRASVGQLEKIRLRNADTPAIDDGKIMGNEPETSQADAASNICDEGNISSNDNSPDVPTSDRISRIRAKQQKQLERNALAQRERHLQQRREKMALHNLLDHAAADAARERRKSLMAEESKLLESRRSEGQQQNALSELEELERTALLQQQDLDYQESLQQDQERAMLVAAKRDLRRRRKEAFEQARDRLAAAGVQCDTVLGGSASSIVGSEPNCRLRLLLPSGQRVEGTFARAHTIGLVYDLALLALEREHLLWKQEESELEDADLGDVDDGAEDEQSDCDLQSTANSYSSIRAEWRDIFHPFSVSSTFPQRTFDNLCETLEDGGLDQGATVMAVVESD